ncbi:hypothetical protein M422DRAFT_786397 [Sphaerobolus stellatus SS14]|uniref:Uncharacterized protein n=1 Tax=Sphaerobolus stellatus (strain SS14) TaxID=990650 RepID=A0A0C9UAT0_SPHS4|nr:hypothetical protein M422DRAFT_786397 [Sphaerobolus stellatus SS14]
MSAPNQPINPHASQDQQKELAGKSSLMKEDDLSSTLSSLEKTNPAIKSDLALPRPTTISQRLSMRMRIGLIPRHVGHIAKKRPWFARLTGTLCFGQQSLFQR